MIKFFNSLTRKKEVFKPIKKNRVFLYTCGPTVYWYCHIGNLKTYLFEDLLKRTLEYNGFKVFHVMNITDVGHLTGDEDLGEDKMELGAKREKKSVKQIAQFYTKEFLKDIKLLNIKKSDVLIKATETIQEQIEFIKILEKKGFTYRTSDGIYFDTSKLKKYGRLWPKSMRIKAGARIEFNPEKKNPNDFALWKFSLTKRQQEWPSPWGIGFPGWHTECVVMAKKFLPIPFDIHCGGIDHILIHHTNEIAQGEAVFGKILARFWLHSAFLKVEGKRMGKSEGNIILLKELIEKGFHPLAFRYFVFNAHYRSILNFTWDGLKNAQNALNTIYQKFLQLKNHSQDIKSSQNNQKVLDYKNKFLQAINDDLNSSKALACVFSLLKDQSIVDSEKKKLLLDFDRVLGFGLDKFKKPTIPQKVKMLLRKRLALRKEGKFEMADKIRKEIEAMGYQVEDTKDGFRVKKII